MNQGERTLHVKNDIKTREDQWSNTIVFKRVFRTELQICYITLFLAGCDHANEHSTEMARSCANYANDQLLESWMYISIIIGKLY